MECLPNYPIAAFRIDDEMANNLAFKMFVKARRFCIGYAYIYLSLIIMILDTLMLVSSA